MALYKPGPLIAGISGNVGGVNFAAAAKRPIIRTARRRPSQDADSLLAPRANLKRIVAAWNALTAASRLAWAAQAATLRRTDRLGQTRPPSGREFFISHNMLLAQAGLALDTTTIPVPYDSSKLGNIDINFPGPGNVTAACTQTGAPTAFGLALYGQLFFRDMSPYLAVSSQLGKPPPPDNYRFITRLNYLPPNYVTIQPYFTDALGAIRTDQTFVVVGRIIQNGSYSPWQNWVIGQYPF